MAGAGSWVAPDDWESILRSEERIKKDEADHGLGASPNEVAHGLAEPDVEILEPAARPDDPVAPTV